MMDPIVVEPVHQGLFDRFLTNDLLEIFWAPLTRQNLVTH